MMNLACRSATVLLVMTALVACSALPMGKQKRETALDASIASYRKLIRWSYYDEAAKYLRTQDGKPGKADLDRVAHYRVTSYTVKNQLLADNGKEARVSALIEYYELDSGVILSLHDEQAWWYDEQDQHWYLATSLPAFGQAQGQAQPGAPTGAASR